MDTMERVTRRIIIGWGMNKHVTRNMASIAAPTVCKVLCIIVAYCSKNTNGGV
jgi:hypothetical protein